MHGFSKEEISFNVDHKVVSSLLIQAMEQEEVELFVRFLQEFQKPQIFSKLQSCFYSKLLSLEN